MQDYEYKVIPAPRRTKRVKGAKTVSDRFARTLTDLMNSEAAEGWEYLRADTLPVEERKGYLSNAGESFQSLLIFRRARRAGAEDREPSVTTLRPMRSDGAEPRRPLSLGPARRDD